MTTPTRLVNNKSPVIFHYLAYASPVIGISFLHSPMAVVHSMYAKYFGIGLTTIAVVLLFARLFDAITDPLIGYWSDRYYARTGTRKPFVVWGIITDCLCLLPFHTAGYSTAGPF